MYILKKKGRLLRIYSIVIFKLYASVTFRIRPFKMYFFKTTTYGTVKKTNYLSNILRDFVR